MAIQKERRAAPRKPGTKVAAQASDARAQASEGPRQLSADEMKRLIAEAAYFRAKERGFAPGYELEDWVQAEAEVRRRLESRA